MGSTNLTIASPDFDAIKHGDKIATADAIRLLWFAFNSEARTRRMGIRQAINQERMKVVTDAPASNQNNYNTGGAGIIYFTGATNFDLTGVLGSGEEGERVTIHNDGSATITVKDDSASSDPTNRIITQTGSDVSLTTGKTIVLHKLASRWREMKLA